MAARWLRPELTGWLPFTPPPVGAQSKTEIGNDMLMPPSASTMLANWSKLSETACWIGIPKSSSIAATSWVSPW